MGRMLSICDYEPSFEALVRIMDKSKQNHSMYSLQLRRSGQVSIHLSKLEVSRVQNTETLTQVERQLASVNTDISFEKSQFQGFWIAVRNGIDISIGRIGDKIINPVANYSDVIREGRHSGDCPPEYLLAANLSPRRSRGPVLLRADGVRHHDRGLRGELRHAGPPLRGHLRHGR